MTAAAQARSQVRSQRGQPEASTREKAKRGTGRSESDNIALLLEMMDADEREEFKNILKRRVLQDARLSDDGEFYPPASLESLMQDEGERRMRG
jgi:hypothetical protein